jgi:prolyl-tRNA synthetase
MKQSQYFVKTNKNVSKDEVSTNARLLEQAGFVEKLMAGVYSYLPLGLRVLKNIEQVVREEMDAIGGQEVLMPILHPKAIWQKTGGWDKIDVLFKINSRTEKEYALGQSEEEVVTPLVMSRVNTHKDLPIAAYQINWKFRDELRAKSGLLRGREFLMKDMYSFHVNQEDFDRYYAIAKQAYLKIYQRLGLVAKVTEASGGSFTQKISYEFMVLTDAGEDDILYCDACEFCVNVEIAKQKEGDTCPKCSDGKLIRATASEVGNVFDLGQKYGKDFDLTFVDEDNQKQYPIMGCYGIGISRLMGVIVEKFNDDKGIIWPEPVAPMKVHLIALKGAESQADQLYQDLQAAKIEVLYDDRAGKSAGEKFADSDLIGIPYRVVVSSKTLAEGSVEVKKRSEDKVELVKLGEAINYF